MLQKLYNMVDDKKIDLVYRRLKKIKGVYADNLIILDDRLTTSEEYCILAEELGHYETTVGNILNCKNLHNLKQEVTARNWASDKLVTLDLIIKAYDKGVRDKYELAEHLGVTDEFLEYSIARLKQVHGVMVKHDDYVIYFVPHLAIYKNI